MWWGWHGQVGPVPDGGLGGQGSEPPMAKCPLALGSYPRVQAGLQEAPCCWQRLPALAQHQGICSPEKVMCHCGISPGAVFFPLCTLVLTHQPAKMLPLIRSSTASAFCCLRLSAPEGGEERNSRNKTWCHTSEAIADGSPSDHTVNQPRPLTMLPPRRPSGSAGTASPEDAKKVLPEGSQAIKYPQKPPDAIQTRKKHTKNVLWPCFQSQP